MWCRKLSSERESHLSYGGGGRDLTNSLVSQGGPKKYVVLMNYKLLLLSLFRGEIFASSLDSNQKYKHYFSSLEGNILKTWHIFNICFRGTPCVHGAEDPAVSQPAPPPPRCLLDLFQLEMAFKPKYEIGFLPSQHLLLMSGQTFKKEKNAIKQVLLCQMNGRE